MITLVIESVARSLLLAAIVWLALTLTRSRNPHLQKLIWSLVLLASLAMPFLMRAHVAPAIYAPDYVLTLQGQSGVAGHSQPAAWSGVTAIYVLVSFVLLSRYAGGLVRMWGIRTRARQLDQHWLTNIGAQGLEVGAQELEVRSSTQVKTPATFGRTILLPTGFVDWSPQKLAAVLAHERAHVLHRDCYLLWLARLHTCLFWCNPLAWWLQRHLAALAETTSDEAAVAVLGDRPGYAEILLEFATYRAVSPVATAIARPDISRRIERVLSEISPYTAPKLTTRIMVMMALLPAVAATAAPLASLRSESGVTHMDSPPHSPDALPQAPSVKAWPDLPELKKYYPPEAERKHIEGTVVMQVTLDAEGRATDTLILFEDPPDQGFGAAASSLAHVMEFNNPTGGTAQLKYKVKFALPHKPAAPSGAGTGAAAGSTAAGVGNTGTGTTNFEQPNNNQTP